MADCMLDFSSSPSDLTCKLSCFMTIVERTLNAGSGSSGRLSTAGLTVEMICSPHATLALKTLIAEGRKKDKLLPC